MGGICQNMTTERSDDISHIIIDNNAYNKDHNNITIDNNINTIRGEQNQINEGRSNNNRRYPYRHKSKEKRQTPCTEKQRNGCEVLGMNK